MSPTQSVTYNYSSKFLWLKIFVILADFHDSSLFRDFEV